jgi:hypothetical protein
MGSGLEIADSAEILFTPSYVDPVESSALQIHSMESTYVHVYIFSQNLQFPGRTAPMPVGSYEQPCSCRRHALASLKIPELVSDELLSALE